MTAEEEAALLAQARSGQGAAFGRLIDAHAAAVRGFLNRLLGGADGADDLAQEAFALAYERLAQFESRARFRTWVCGIAWRLAKGHRRSVGRRMQREADWLALEEATQDARPGQEARVLVRRALATLPDDQRAVLTLCLGLEFSHAEAAEALGLPLGTVKSHIARGRARLAAALEPDHEG
jgi:RNA polymerase sigma factor (sigma-70 family)